MVLAWCARLHTQPCLLLTTILWSPNSSLCPRIIRLFTVPRTIPVSPVSCFCKWNTLSQNHCFLSFSSARLPVWKNLHSSFKTVQIPPLRSFLCFAHRVSIFLLCCFELLLYLVTSLSQDRVILFNLFLCVIKASLVVQLVKNLPAMWETWVWYLGGSPGEGKGYPLQYSGLENSMDCIVHGVAKSWTWLSNFHFTSLLCYNYLHVCRPYGTGAPWSQKPVLINRCPPPAYHQAWFIFSKCFSVQVSRVRLFATPWTAAHQASLSIPTSGAYSNSCPSNWWCHPTISSSVVPFSSRLQSFPASGSFPMSQFFSSGGQSIGVSTSASVLPMNIQDWFPLAWTGWISLQSKELSSVFSNSTVQKHQFFSAQLFL